MKIGDRMVDLTAEEIAGLPAGVKVGPPPVTPLDDCAFRDEHGWHLADGTRVDGDPWHRVPVENAWKRDVVLSVPPEALADAIERGEYPKEAPRG